MVSHILRTALSRLRHGVVTSFVICAIGMQPVFAQGVVPTPSAPGDLNVGTAPNGVPLVNIATPNGQGLSHNQYDQFNVGTEGLILNNQAGTFSSTQLGGVVPANENLAASGAARVILNEVVSDNRSALEGVVEVAGQSADVIVANPNGITCNGCGFIRTPRVVLTTGTPDIVGGSLQGFAVDGGDIVFGVDGADLSQVSLFDVISREITFEGAVAGQDVRLAAGRNSFAYATGAVTPLADDGSAAPAFGIDSTAVGGLYAGRISLLSTEQGVAVRAPREMSANAGGMTLTADGRLVIGRAQASGPVTARADNAAVVVQTSLFAEDAITLTGISAELRADATLASASDLTLDADTVTLRSGALAAAGMAADGTFGPNGDLRIETEALSANGATLAAANDLRIENAGALDITGGTLSARGDVGIAATDLETSADIDAGGQLIVIADGDWENAGDMRVGGAGSLRTSGDFENSGAIVAAGDFELRAANIMSSGPIGSSVGDVTVETLGDITNTGLIYSGRDVTLLLDGDLRNASADLIAEGGITIQGATGARAASVLNRSANIEAITGSILISAALVDNSQPTPTLVPDVSTRTREGVATDFPDVSHPGRTYRVVETTTVTNLVAEPTTNEPARIRAGGDLSIDATVITNDYSEIAANGDVTLNAGTITNTGRDLVQTTVVSTVSYYTERYCRFRLGPFGCLNRGTRHLTRTNTDTSTVTAGAVFATIQAGGTLEAKATGYLGNNAVRGDATQIGLSSGDHALVTPPRIGAVNPNTVLDRAALFTPSNTPNGPFLVETRPEFIDVSRFLSSDYFLQQIGGYNADLTQRRFGDAYVEARLIQEQMFALTGRRTTEDPAALRRLMQDFYDNAVTSADALQLTAGVALSGEQIAALSDTIIWLEEQVIDGEAVLVPVVYLGPNGLDETSLASARIAAAEVGIDAGNSANSGLIAGDTRLDIASDGDLLNIGGQLVSDGDVGLSIEGRFANVSGQVTGDDVAIAAGEVENSTAVIRDETPFGFQDRPQATGEITANVTLTIESDGDITSEGGEFAAGEDILLDADGDIVIGALMLDGVRRQDFDEGYDYSMTRDAELAGVTAGGDVTFQAGEDLTIAGAEIEAGGDAMLSAGGDVDISSVQEIRQDDYRFDIDTGWFLGVETNIRQQEQETTTEQTTITAGGELGITSETGDVTLRAPELQSGGETVLSAENGQVALLTTEDSAFNRDEFREEDLLWWNSEDTGASEITRTFTQIEAGGGLRIVSGGEVIAEYTATGDFSEGISQLAAAPGLEWMAELEAMDNVAWQEARTAFEEWDYEEQGLTEASALLVSVVTSHVLGMPGIEGFITNTASSWAGGSTFLAQAFEAGMRSLATQVAVSAVNNQGDLGAVLEELGSGDSIRGLVTAMVSAGLSAHLLEGTELVGDLPAGTPFAEQAFRDLQAELVRASVDATVEAAINGGNLGEAMFDGWTNAMVLSGLSVVQNEIGDFALENDIPEGSLSHALAHAVAGGLAAELAGEDFAGGALGAAIAALTGPGIGESGLSAERQVDLQNLIATAAVLIATDGDTSGADLAGDIAGSAHENNYLRHDQWVEYLDRIAQCGDNPDCVEDTHVWAETAALENQHGFRMCREVGDCDRYIAEIEAAESGGLTRNARASDVVNQLQNWSYIAARNPQIAHGSASVASVLDLTGITDGTTSLSYHEFAVANCGDAPGAACVAAYDSLVDNLQQSRDVENTLVTLGIAGAMIAPIATPELAALCMASPTCRSTILAFEAAGTLSDVTACAGGDPVACAATAIPVATTGGAGEDLADLIPSAPNRVVPNRTGPSLSQSQIDEIVGTPHGQRPDPSTYMSQAEIDAHLARFDDGAVRFTSRSAVDSYGTAGNSEAFVMPRSEFDRVVSEAGGDLRMVEQRLGLDIGSLSNGDAMAVHISRQDLSDLRIPTGNEGGANNQWVPGGFTSGGVPEAVVDLTNAPFTEIPF